jgi:ribonuclease HII
LLLSYYQDVFTEAGLDEAGRGSFAGPVYAAAVIMPKDFHHPVLNDSKQLSERQRDLLRPLIEKESICYAVMPVDNRVIDSINILQATYKAMHLCLDGLKKKPGFLLVDGNRFKSYKKIPHQTIVEGDGKYVSIAAASILAKTYRDAYMKKLHLEFPQYGWDTNKGYGTQQHRLAIKQYGLCKYHRKSFNIWSTQLSMDW